jgi:biotin transport system substrate-specific component
MLLGIVVIYLVGIPYLYLMLNFYLGKKVLLWQVTAGMGVLMLIDVVKALAAAVVAKSMVKRLASVVSHR